MVSTPQSQFSGFRADALDALLVPGVAERWAAVQAHLHPQLVALAEQLRDAGMRRFPREWPLYEFSFRSLRYINHPGGREPIDNYHMGLDRPPRGCGVYIVVSGAERAIIVALQLSTRQRKVDLRQVWEGAARSGCRWSSVSMMSALLSNADNRRKTKDERRKTKEAQILPLRPPSFVLRRMLVITRSPAHPLTPSQRPGWTATWPRAARPTCWPVSPTPGTMPASRSQAFAEQIVEDMLALFPLNEAIMEQAEALEPQGAALLRERRADYQQPAIRRSRRSSSASTRAASPSPMR